MATIHDATDIKLLRIFTTVVDNGGFSCAQVSLNLSTASISNYISNLESRLNCRLCQRGHAGFKLTPMGELVYEEAIKLFKQVDNFNQTITLSKRDLTGELKIGMADCTATDENSPLISALQSFFQQLNYQIKIQIKTITQYEVQEMLLQDKLDLAIGTFLKLAKGLNGHPIYQESLELYCSYNHPIFRHKQITQSLIRKQNFVVSGTTINRKLAKDFGFSSHATTDFIEQATLLILSGNYIGFLPTHYANYWLQKQQLRSLLPRHYKTQNEFSLIYRKKSKHSKLTRELIDHIKSG